MTRRLTVRAEIVRRLVVLDLRDGRGARDTYRNPCSGGEPCTAKSEDGCR